ncbi:MAG TPA: T9SS type A sorting domain-containing protein [Bacteroidota bacterium]|nr:T9SS type A sorting domain-containing protein [Bacteroidota bacterium]
MNCARVFRKSYMLGLLCLLFIPQFVYSQIDTTLKDYFPMRVGDYWEYLTLGDSPENSELFYQKVVGDTVMTNGQSYRVFVGGTIYPPWITQKDTEYYRIDDSLRVWRYRGIWAECQDNAEMVWYDLGAADSSLWPVCYMKPFLGLTHTNIQSYGALNLILPTKEFVFVDTVGTDTIWGPVDWGTAYLAKGIGCAKSVGGWSVSNLQGTIINGVKYGKLSGVENKSGPMTIPKKFSVLQNYPNPFNPTTTIAYDLPRRVNVRLSVYDVLGRTVATIFDGVQEPGTHRTRFDASRLPCGVYFYQLLAGDFVQTQKMILMK